MSSKHVLTVPGRFEEVRHICEFVVAGATDAGLSNEIAFQIELACDEAATNIIEHAYGDDLTGTITVGYSTSNDAFTVTLRDHGRPFNPAEIPPPPIVATEIAEVTPHELGNQLQVGGLGLHMIRKLMDEVYFSFDGAQGNTLTMVKRLGDSDKK